MGAALTPSVIGLFEHQDIPFMRVRQAVLPDMPGGGPALLATVPIELQYFHTAHEEWTPAAGVVERPGADKGPDELFYRGHLQPLRVTFLDDGLESVVAAVIADPGLRLSELALTPARVER